MKLRGLPDNATVRELADRLVGEAERSGGEAEFTFEVEERGYRCMVVRVPETGSSEAHGLSPREQEIARMVAQGHANKTIAAVLDISVWTVGTYLRKIFLKMGVNSRAAMVARLADLGILHIA
jgi:DNA-binding CsgD family transcriptional regulator